MSHDVYALLSFMFALACCAVVVGGIIGGLAWHERHNDQEHIRKRNEAISVIRKHIKKVYDDYETAYWYPHERELYVLAREKRLGTKAYKLADKYRRLDVVRRAGARETGNPAPRIPNEITVPVSQARAMYLGLRELHAQRRDRESLLRDALGANRPAPPPAPPPVRPPTARSGLNPPANANTAPPVGGTAPGATPAPPAEGTPRRGRRRLIR